MPDNYSASGESIQRTRRQIRSENAQGASRDLSDRAEEAWGARNERDEKRGEMQRLQEANEQFEGLGWGSKMLLFFLGVPAHVFAYGIDVLLLSVTATHLMNLGFGETLGEASGHLLRTPLEPSIIGLIGSIIIPGLTLGIDIVISYQMLEAGKRPRQLGNLAQKAHWKKYNRWKWTGYGLALVIAGFVAAVYVKSLAVSGKPVGFLHYLELACLVGLALIVHGGIIYGGALLHRGRAYTFYRLRRWQLRRRVRRAEAAYDEARQAVIRALSTYREAQQAYRQHHPDEELALPLFDRRVRTIVNDIFGYTVMATPEENGPSANRNAQADTPPPAPEEPQDPDASPAEPAPTPPSASGDAPSGDGAMPSGPATPRLSEGDVPQEDDPVSDAGDEGRGLEAYYQNLYEADRRDADGEISL